jgi:hypothetical protein
MGVAHDRHITSAPIMLDVIRHHIARWVRMLQSDELWKSPARSETRLLLIA